MIGRALRTITDMAVSRRGKYRVLLAWLLLAGALSSQAGRLPSLYVQTLTSRLPAGAQSQQALALAQREFQQARGTPALVVLFDANGLDLADRRIAEAISAWLLSSAGPGDLTGLVSVYATPQAGSQLISPDGTTMVMVAQLRSSGVDAETARAVAAIRQRLAAVTAGSSLQAYVTGPAAIAVDAGAVFCSVDLQLLLSTVALVLVLIYRSPTSGAIDPTTVYVQLDGSAYERLAAIDASTAAAQALPEVAFVRSPTGPDGNAPAIPSARLQTLVSALAGTISVLAGLPLTVLFQLGACVAAGILLDTFLVRTLIVPGLVLWLGRLAWWPLQSAHSPG